MDETGAQREFRLDVCLGRGGFGEVYRGTMASPGGLDAEVAVKVLRGDLDPRGQAVQRLRDEGRLLARLNHPTILKVHDLVVLEGRVSLVTEFVDGDDLAECIHSDDAIPVRATLEVLSAVASALDAAWQTLEIVHRDIKPSNIRISRHGETKLLDFGIARTDSVTREARTQTDTMIGSPAYMAPERFLENVTHPSSDVFALGATLFESLAQKRLFADVPVPMMASLALDDERYADYITERLDILPRGTPDEVLALLVDMIVHDPKDRPSAAEVAKRCQVLADQVKGPTLSRWCRDHTWPAVTAQRGPLEGRVLTEGTLARPTVSEPTVLPEPTERTAPRVGGIVLGGAAVTALAAVGVLALLVGIVGIYVLSQRQAEPAEAAPALVAPAPEPETAPDATPPAATKKKAKNKAKKKAKNKAPQAPPAPTSAPTPAPTPAPATATPAPAPAAGVHVASDGDVVSSLSGAGRVWTLPGKVPPGTYTVLARYNGRDDVPAGRLTVKPGGNHLVSCSSRMFKCQIR